jgi:hypothetical protein
VWRLTGIMGNSGGRTAEHEPLGLRDKEEINGYIRWRRNAVF